MSIFGSIFKVLGFESQDDVKQVKKKTKKTQNKASFNLKKDKLERPEQIDGVKVIYAEGLFSAKKALDIYKNGQPVLINVQEAEEKERILAYLDGFVSATNGKIEVIEDKILVILLPEGVEIE